MKALSCLPTEPDKDWLMCLAWCLYTAADEAVLYAEHQEAMWNLFVGSAFGWY